ncbi:YjeF-related protein N-terminus-domain-containing protein [Xylaria sp. FL0043]|nr:YjeF-related protein N-terminus-domain-containing protein [Xylaria sp. FL0043]
MERSPLSRWLGGPYQIVLREPPGEQVAGILRNLVPEQHLTLEKATIFSTRQQFERLDIRASNVYDIIPLPAGDSVEPELRGMSSSASSLSSPPAAPSQSAFQDPAIVSMSRKPTAQGAHTAHTAHTAVQTANPHHADHADHAHHARRARRAPHETETETETVRTPVTTNPTDESANSFDDADTPETTTAHHLPPISHLSVQTLSNPAAAVTAALDAADDERQDLTPTAATARSGLPPQERRRGKRGGKRQQQPAINDTDEGTPASSARPTNQRTGWRQTPILQSTKSFQPFASLKKGQKKRADPSADSGWASEDVTDVQEAGDFDFEGSLAKFDKRTIFNEMREQDRVDEADRLVSHNRLPRPKPGTAGGKNLHYTENVLDLPTAAPKITKETPGDFWRSEADDDPVNGGGGGGGGETPSGREGSGRNSRLRGESRMSTTRRSQSRKASASAGIAGPSRVNSGPSSASPGLYTLTSNRRVDVVTHLQMLVVENIAGNELGMTEDLIAENAGRGICEVAMSALDDPAVRLRAAASSPPATNTIVVVAGNNRSGARAIAAARHLRNRNINILVSVVGIEREGDLLDEIRKQIRLFRNFGGTIYTKSALFEQLAQSANSLNASNQVSVSLIIDALLGLTISFEELRKSDQATTYELMAWANRNEAFVLAIDIPSGIEPSTGRVNVIDGAKLYVQPRYVVALGAPKAGLLKALESMHDTGDITMADEWKIYLADIGLGAVVWRKAAKIRRGPDFDDHWVLQLRYHPPKNDDQD